MPGLGKGDQLVIDFSLICYTIQENKCSTEKLNFFKGNYNNIRNQLSLVNWHDDLNGMNLLQSWSRFAEININLMKNNIQVSKPNRDGSNCTPFITRPCLNAIKEKRKHWLKYKYCKSDENFKQYKVSRNIVTANMRTAKYQYEKNLASKIKSDNKIFWNYVRSKTKTKSIVTKLEMPDEKLSSTDQETANVLNDYFSTVFEVEPDEPIPEFEQVKARDLITFIQNSLKEAKDLIIIPHTIIFQKSLDDSILPPIWKKPMLVLYLRKEKRKIQEITVL